MLYHNNCCECCLCLAISLSCCLAISCYLAVFVLLSCKLCCLTVLLYLAIFSVLLSCKLCRLTVSLSCKLCCLTVSLSFKLCCLTVSLSCKLCCLCHLAVYSSELSISSCFRTWNWKTLFKIRSFLLQILSSRAGNLRYFLTCSLRKLIFFAFFLKLIDWG